MGLVIFSALATELQTDPRGFGFATLISTGDYQGMVARLTSVSANVSLGSISTVSVAMITAASLQSLVVGTEFLALSTGAQNLWNGLLIAAINSVAISNTTIRTQATTVWSAGTTTRGNLVAAQNRQASRIEVLFGEGATLTWETCFKALFP